MAHDIQWTIPPTGEQMDSVRLVAWLVQPGEHFEADQILLEIETDKSVIEIPAPAAGQMLEHLVTADARMAMDTPVARLALEGEAPEASAPPGHAHETARSASASASASDPDPDPDPDPEHVPSTPAIQTVPPPSEDPAKPPATPAARAEARRAGLDLQALQGTGPGERITLGDVRKASARAPAPSGQNPATIVLSTRHGDVHARVWEANDSSSPTILLIHGLFADWQAWAATAHQLNRWGLRVVALDLPGHGRSTARALDLRTMAEAAGDAAARTTSGPLVLVGHSFGAAVAARLARQPGHMLQSLVLLAPAGLGTEINQCFIDGMLNAHTAEALGRELGKLSAGAAAPSAAFLEDWLQAMPERRAALAALCANVAVNGVQQIDIRADLDALTCPIALVHGRVDQVIPWRHALEAPPSVALHLVPGAGHMPQWDAATLTLDVIRQAVFSRS